MKHLLAIALVAAGLSGCANPPPPEIITNTIQWVSYLCGFVPPVDAVIEVFDDAGRTTDVRAAAKIICAEFTP